MNTNKAVSAPVAEVKSPGEMFSRFIQELGTYTGYEMNVKVSMEIREADGSVTSCSFEH